MPQIKISHEVPRCLLTASPEFNDYDYCLPHLLDQDEEYKQYFIDARNKGRYIIMDNSLHELGKAYDYDRLLHWVGELQPNEFIVPDVWMKHAQTVSMAKYWKQFNYPKKTIPIAVIQGEDKNAAYLCAGLLVGLGYNKLCISYGADWYNDFFPHTNKDLGKSLGRIRFVNGLLNLKQYNNIKFHLLGCSVPQEFGWYDNHPQIESIDTSNPVFAALERNIYNSNGLNEKPVLNMNTSFDIDGSKVNYNLVLKNIKKFRKINGLKNYGRNT